MGYNVEISVNMLKETKFSELENSIENMAKLHDCESIYSLTEEDGTKKIPRYHYLFVIHFTYEHLDSFLKFIRIIKSQKMGYIECIYDNHIFKLIYASSYYLTNMIDKESSQKYRLFIGSKLFSPQEEKLLKELNKI
jgi:hypothetical protein